jgi:hypothetical protein
VEDVSFWLSDEGLLVLTRPQEGASAPPAAPGALTHAQFATLEALIQVLLPETGLYTGMVRARVARSIEALFAESDDFTKLEWLSGLAELDREAKAGFGVPFAELSAVWMRALVAEISRNEHPPQTALEAFIHIAQRTTIHGFCTPEIWPFSESPRTGEA